MNRIANWIVLRDSSMRFSSFLFVLIVSTLALLLTLPPYVYAQAAPIDPQALEHSAGSGKGAGAGGGAGSRQGRGHEPVGYSGKPVDISLFAAASAKPACELLISIFKRGYNVNFITHYASSGALAKEIVDGASAQIFIPEGSRWLEPLGAQKLLVENVEYYTNPLVLVVPEQSSEVAALQDLLKPELKKLSLPAVNESSAGRLAKLTLEKLELWDQLEKKLSFEKDQAKTVQLLESGKLQAAMLYRSSVWKNEKIKIVHEFSDEVSEMNTYPVALLQSASDSELALRFYKFIGSHFGDKAFRQFGFASTQQSSAGKKAS